VLFWKLCVSLCKGSNEVEWVHKEVINGGGGILSTWHKLEFKCDNQEVEDGYVVTFG